VPLRQLRRVRWAVRAALALGVAASVAANVLHAEQNLIAQTIAAWPPLALLLNVELISRIPMHRRHLAAIRLVATAAIAGIAAFVSYWHMVAVAARYGETGSVPFLLPISVDGLVIVASVSLVELAGRVREAEQDRDAERAEQARRAAAVPVAAAPYAAAPTARPAAASTVPPPYAAVPGHTGPLSATSPVAVPEGAVPEGAVPGGAVPGDGHAAPGPAGWQAPAAGTDTDRAAGAGADAATAGRSGAGRPPLGSGVAAALAATSGVRSPGVRAATGAHPTVARPSRTAAAQSPSPRTTGRVSVPTGRGDGGTTDRAAGQAVPRPRRPVAETLRLIEEITAERPHTTDEDLADELGITLKRLRTVRAEARSS
jgi:hypothetical protein